MSVLTETSGVALRARMARAALFVTIALVLALSVAEFINLAGRHTVGPESYGLLVAGIAVATGIFSLGLVLTSQRRVIATVAVLALWAIVALGGIAGSYYHIVGVAPEYGPVDPRPRPVAAPLIFSVLGIVGGTAVLIGQGDRRRARNLGEE